ncbi:hypothetical protein [Nocardia asteroides]|uniref:hypothetical protein n=1 Tax=Nocardia asteroides TaxID=1824 RepID=UPI001E560316|nr:hypothetical protein [Nocardia asteroides]UGT53997.1 hypothetical protein LTT85_25555 [Nocardia asteroides]
MGFDRIADHRLPTSPRPVPASQPDGGPLRRWGELRERLWDPATPMGEVDAIWVWLIARVRDRAESAMLVSAALAAPMLARITGEHTTPGTPARHDAESEALTEFLLHLSRVEVAEPGVWHRLRWTAFRADRKAAIEQRSDVTVVGDLEGALAGLGERAQLVGAGVGHPEAVLADAVAAEVISADAAELIAASRWEGRSLTAVAAERGVAVGRLRKQRSRAERALRAWLADRTRDLDPDRSGPVEAETVTALAPRVLRPRRGRRPNPPSVVPAQSSTEHGQVAA